MSITILLADDHRVVRQGLRALLESDPELVVIGEANDGFEAIQLVEKLNPQITIVDIMMPGLGGLEVTRQINNRTKVVILSMHANEAYVFEALQNGAYGYVLKDSTAEDLVRAIHNVAAGRHFLSPPFSEKAISAYIEKSQPTQFDPYKTLTTREREVFHLVVEGLSNATISTRLSISPRTVETHRSNLMNKLSLHSQADLIRYAIKRGIISME